MRKVEVLAKKIINKKFEVVLYRKPNPNNEFDTNYYAVSVTDLKNDNLLDDMFKKFSTIENLFEIGGTVNDHALQKARAYYDDACQKFINHTFVSKDERELEKGMLVGVHWNSHRNMYSVVKMKSRNTLGLVLGYVPNIELVDVTFKIDESKKRNVVEQGTKDRHAFVVGLVENFGMMSFSELSNHNMLSAEIKYNPFKYEGFVTMKFDELKIVESVESVVLLSSEKKPCVMFDDAYNYCTVKQ